MGDLAYTISFYVLSAITLLAAAGVIFKRNLVHSALLLALSFIGIGGLYLLLHADFLAAVQILVYNGAVAVIIVIGIMLTRWQNLDNSSPSNTLGLTGGIMAALVTGIILLAVTSTPWAISATLAPSVSAPAIASILLSDFAIAFEAAAVLLLVAMIGAIMLAKGADKA